MEIKLVKNGIFPITRNADGTPAEPGPETSYDFPGTVQGEGKLAGIPVLFIRTSGCNLRCTWTTDDGRISICDTPYASHYTGEVEIWQTEDVVDTVRANAGNIRHVVISGGEPTIQPEAVVELARLLKTGLKLHVTLETNGVLFIQELSTWIDLFSISPKLASSEPGREKNRKLENPVEDHYIRDHRKFRRNTDSLQRYINACMNIGSYYGEVMTSTPARKPDKDFQLKFVISRKSDLAEIRKNFLEPLSFIEPTDVVLMPLGETADILKDTSRLAARLAVQHGYRYTPRLQIDLFGNRAGT